MTGDAFLTEPAGGVGRAMQAGARTPLLDQEFDSGTLYALRAAVQAHASRAGLSEDRVGEVVLAVHELAANAIAHGAGHGRLRMWDLAGALSCEIVDAGPAGRGLCPQSRRSGRCLQSWRGGQAPGRGGSMAGRGRPRPVAGAAGGRPAGPTVGAPWHPGHGHLRAAAAGGSLTDGRRESASGNPAREAAPVGHVCLCPHLPGPVCHEPRSGAPVPARPTGTDNPGPLRGAGRGRGLGQACRSRSLSSVSMSM